MRKEKVGQWTVKQRAEECDENLSDICTVAQALLTDRTMIRDLPVWILRRTLKGGVAEAMDLAHERNMSRAEVPARILLHKA